MRRGQYAGIQITGRDITERKQMEEERERLHAELEVRAITDSLTGLYNHAHFFQRLAEEIERSKRYNHGFAVRHDGRRRLQTLQRLPRPPGW